MDEVVRVGPGADGTLDVALCGDIDYNNSVELVRHIRAAVTQAQPSTVRVDVTGVTFLDSSGLGVLVTVYRLATAMEAGYQVIGPRQVVFEQLRLAGLVDLFGIEAPSAALSRPAGRGDVTQ